MACGKSTLVEVMREGTNLPAVDLDIEITKRAGCSVPEIFQRGGLAQFRELEQRVLAGLDPIRPLLLATGGGSVETAANTETMRRHGVVIWLDADWEILRTRLEDAPQRYLPMIEHLGWDALRRLYLRRRRLYARAAHFRLRSDRAGIGNTARNAMLRSLVWQRRLEGAVG
jgi:shikimate kinase